MTLHYLWYDGVLHKTPITTEDKDPQHAEAYEIANFDAQNPIFQQLQKNMTLNTTATWLLPKGETVLNPNVLERQTKGTLN